MTLKLSDVLVLSATFEDMNVCLFVTLGLFDFASGEFLPLVTLMHSAN